MDAIIVDTSSILFGLSKRIDVFEKIEEQLDLSPIVSEGVVRELRMISEGKKAQGMQAKAAMLMIENHDVEVRKGDEYVDKWIIRNAKEFGSVCTNDSALKRKLKAMGVQTYSLSMDGRLR